MSTINAAASGQFTLGDITINRLGFGAMRITGKGVWGEPEDRQSALDTLRRLPELGINFIDTADSYGPDVSENLIREALYPYDGLLIATKGGLTRHGPNIWQPVGRPEYLRQAVLMSLRKLKVEQIGLWQLHRVDAKVPEDEQFDAIAQMQKEGLIRHVGLSEVNVQQIKNAQRFFPVVSVQNMFNLVSRGHEAVLDYCTENNIGFIPWFPLAAGELANPGSILDTLAKEKGFTPGQIALAWILKRSPVMLPIPGTGKVKHLEENLEATQVQLTEEEFRLLDDLGRKRQ
ncbi:aldo/keto reductase [Acerihabitans arboris]|uniref:Oxidoreductase n=1 Tax=Acerihabitans arboris TaxID=2691583 RepID=A0A845SLE1_9GAMM|nr:aldo/keto reductase [Acerihabitans arboris]NDL63806.1 oxidoreductase [Acerihabitans arboris]